MCDGPEAPSEGATIDQQSHSWRGEKRKRLLVLLRCISPIHSKLPCHQASHTGAPNLPKGRTRPSAILVLTHQHSNSNLSTSQAPTTSLSGLTRKEVTASHTAHSFPPLWPSTSSSTLYLPQPLPLVGHPLFYAPAVAWEDSQHRPETITLSAQVRGPINCPTDNRSRE
jgi:hypothetical protein